jgi:hypothetical protein
MKNFATLAIIAASASAVNIDARAQILASAEVSIESASKVNQAWTETVVSPPDASCCNTAWVAGCQNTLQLAIDGATPFTILKLLPGIYCNTDYISLQPRNT